MTQADDSDSHFGRRDSANVDGEALLNLVLQSLQGGDARLASMTNAAVERAEAHIKDLDSLARRVKDGEDGERVKTARAEARGEVSQLKALGQSHQDVLTALIKDVNGMLRDSDATAETKGPDSDAKA